MTDVSYLVTVYNKRPYLPAVLAAIAADAAGLSYEIVVVDDGSTDGSAAWLAAALAGRDDARLIVQANGGASAAMNTAAAQARGVWLRMVDADDLVLPGSTTLLCRRAEAVSAVLAVGTGRDYAFDALETLAGGLPVAPATTAERVLEAPLGETLRCSRYNPSRMLVDRKAYAMAGGCDPAVTCQDYALALRLALLGRFVELAAPVAMIARGDPGRLSAGKGRELSNVTLAVAHFLADHPELPEPFVRQAVVRAYKRAWLWSRRRGQLAQGLRFALSALAIQGLGTRNAAARITACAQAIGARPE